MRPPPCGADWSIHARSIVARAGRKSKRLLAMIALAESASERGGVR